MHLRKSAHSFGPNLRECAIVFACLRYLIGISAHFTASKRSGLLRVLCCDLCLHFVCSLYVCACECLKAIVFVNDELFIPCKAHACAHLCLRDRLTVSFLFFVSEVTRARLLINTCMPFGCSIKVQTHMLLLRLPLRCPCLVMVCMNEAPFL